MFAQKGGMKGMGVTFEMGGGGGGGVGVYWRNLVVVVVWSVVFFKKIVSTMITFIVKTLMF